MRTRRIELEGSVGHVSIYRQAGSTEIQIEAYRPTKGITAWAISARITNEELFRTAADIHHRIEGWVGSNSEIHDVYRELQRFQD